MTFPDSSFWDFSLALYSREGVADACLRLQERHGVDINFLFFCHWLGETGRDVDAADIETLHGAVAEWHEVAVKHLRALRKRLKRPLPPVDETLAQRLRAQIQKIEIDAEHIEQLTLDAHAPAASPGKADAARRAAASRNISAYLGLLGVKPSAADKADLALIGENVRAVAGG